MGRAFAGSPSTCRTRLESPRTTRPGIRSNGTFWHPTGRLKGVVDSLAGLNRDSGARIGLEKRERESPLRGCVRARGGEHSRGREHREKSTAKREILFILF